MADNAQKTHYGLAINQFAEKKIADAIQLLGKALPCSVFAVSGSIVTVSFDLSNIPFTLPNVTMPMFGPEYIRYPTQVGDLGVTMVVDAYLGGVSGLGGGSANLLLHANLSTLFFMPVSSKNWTRTDDPNAVVIYGPDGTIIRDTAGKSKVTVNPNSGVTAATGGDQTNVNAGTGLQVTGSTAKVIQANLPQAVNDAAAAALGVPVNGFYHNNNGVLIRVT